ncbi:sigma factor-like helix-turn-helix DNA-binding protein [Brevibacterium picturae]|uniref:RNA polymerase sigma-70 region 4 domain-containing protein n=1 Tax=Brevibacterium picturae TaxID=260553 RepID=A0ABP4NNT8_9MICO
MAKGHKLPPRTPENDTRARLRLEREKSVLELRRKGKTYEEIGEKLGMSTNAARNLGWRAKHRPEHQNRLERAKARRKPST